MTVIPLRLRVRLEFWTRDQRLLQAAAGIELPPQLVVPARTTLRVVDIFSERVLALTPDGTRVMVSRETIERHGYVPRG